MSDQPALRGCPDEMMIVAFVEGVLDPETRRIVERHAADCPECPLVIAKTAGFLKSYADEAAADAVSRQPRWRWLATAAVAAFCIPVVVWQLAAQRDPLRRIKRIASESPVRAVEGRLAGFEHVPFSLSRSGAQAKDVLVLRAEAERLAEERRTDARSLHARGVALLLTGDAASAVKLLTDAAQAEPRKEAIWNDLAVAHLEVARNRDASRLAEALAATGRALALSPTAASAHFNRGLALEHLRRADEAVREYGRVIALEPGSPWGEESARRIAILRE